MQKIFFSLFFLIVNSSLIADALIVKDNTGLVRAQKEVNIATVEIEFAQPESNVSLDNEYGLEPNMVSNLKGSNRHVFNSVKAGTWQIISKQQPKSIKILK